MGSMHTDILVIESNPSEVSALEQCIKTTDSPFDYTIVTSPEQAAASAQGQVFAAVVAGLEFAASGLIASIVAHSGAALVLTIPQGAQAQAAAMLKTSSAEFLVKDSEYEYLKLLPLLIERA